MELLGKFRLQNIVYILKCIKSIPNKVRGCMEKCVQVCKLGLPENEATFKFFFIA